MKTIIYLTLTLLALSLPKPTCAAPADLSNLLQKALFEEEANQNLNAAIQNYQALIQQSEEQRKLVATAIFRLGECYRKQGRTNEAAAQYQQLLSNYSDQTTLVSLSRQNLVGLGRLAATTGSMAPSTEPKLPNPSELTSSQSKFAEQLQALTSGEIQIKEVAKVLEDSPDLVNGKPGEEPWLNQAAKEGKLKFAEFLLEHGADVDVRGKQEMTPLVAAVKANQKAMVELLLAHGANVNARFVSGHFGQTALHLAADNGNKAIAEILISHKAEINAVCNYTYTPNEVKLPEDWDGATPLHRATIKGQKSIAELLLQKGANVAAKDRRGTEPLHNAVLNNYVSIAQLLLTNKADINAGGGQFVKMGYSANGCTPLILAIENSSLEMAEFLLKNKANVNAPSENLTRATPLHVAVSKLNPAMVDLLLSYKADLNATNSNGLMPLHALIGQTGDDATLRKKIFDSLVAAGADINAQVKSIISYAPLHMAVEKRDELLFRAILEHKPNLNLPAGAAWDRRTPLHLAVQVADALHLRMAERLLAADADVNAATDSRNRTPLFYAIDSGLLPKGDTKTVQLEGKQMIELLLKYKANVNVLDTNGTTPLALAKGRRLPVWAPPQQHPEIVEEVIALLKNAGANEALDRLTQIDVTRRGQYVGLGFSRAYTNNWTQHTLGEVLAKSLGYISFLNYETNQGKLAFPDLTNVKVTRWDISTGRAQEIPVNVTSMLQSSNHVDDFLLQWGDSVEIPELDHNTTEVWKGLTTEEVLNLYEMLGREVTITVKGQAHRRIVYAASRNFNRARKPGSPDLGSSSFDLGPVLRDSGLLRVSSDTSRIKVIRKDPQSNQTRETVVNIEKETAIWLQNGDVIEVPETN